jgi:uncharacterized protein YecT (DUF1311 family)
MKTCCLLIFCFFCFAAFASDCSNMRNVYEQGYCFNKIYYEVDEELNRNYKQLSILLTKSQAKTLKNIQIKWIGQRDKLCSMKHNNKIYMDMKCAVETTKTQNEFLKSQLKICEQGSCGIASDNERRELIPKGKFKASYYHDKKLVASEIVDAISINYSYNEFMGIPAESFEATWEADIEVKEDTTLILAVSVSWSAVAVYVDDEKITGWSNNNKELPIKVSKGQHRIKIEYTNGWHTVNFNASFVNYPRLTMSDAAKKITPFINNKTKTLYVGAYESGNSYNEAIVKIGKNMGPVVIFLSSYEAIRWKIENPFKVKINAVLFNSYDPGSSVSISTEKTKIFRLSGLPYAYESFAEVSSLIQQLTGVIPSYTYGEYALTHVEVPEF